MELRRRALLSGAGAAAAAFAGCATVESRLEGALPPDGHPMAGSVSVAVVDRSESGHDLGALAREALSFWETNAAEYAGFEVDYRLAEPTPGDGPPPDVEIVFRDDRQALEGCREFASEEVLGCAPLLEAGRRFDAPATAEVVATGRPYGAVLTTTEHELGHTLGLGHDDEPAFVMSNDIEDRLPEYESRTTVLEAIEAAWQTRNEATRLYNDGIGRWNDREYDAAAAAFSRAESRYAGISASVETAAAAAGAFESMTRPDTVDRLRLETYFERARAITEYSAEMAGLMAAAAEAAAAGDRSEARDLQADADDRSRRLRELEFPSPTDTARALGLVRDADEPDQTDAERT
jgi:hypothetical protein